MAARIAFYFTPGCGYCVRARRLLEDLGLPFDAINVAGDWAKRAWLEEVTGSHTVPQLFLDGRSLGGSDDLHALQRSGELARLWAEDPPAAPST